MRIENDSVPGTVTGVSGLIDVHAHFVARGYRKAMERAGTAVEGDLSPVWNAEQILDVMGDLGIEYSVLSPAWPLPEFADGAEARRAAREFNEELADQIADDPRTFGGVAFLPLPDVDGALEELAYALDVLKLDGAHVVASYRGRYPGDPAFTPLLEELNRRRISVVTHPTGPRHAPLDLMFETTRLAFDLIHGGVLERYPDVAWILAHGGATILQTSHLLREPVRVLPDPGPIVPAEDVEPGAAGLVHAAPGADAGGLPLGGLHVDVVCNVDEPRLSGLVALLGPDRLLYGSGLPDVSASRVERDITALRDNAAIDDAVKVAVACENALRLFPSVTHKLRRERTEITVCNGPEG